MQLLVLLLISVFTLGACQVLDLTTIWTDLPSNSVLFQDDFTDPSSGWKNLSHSDVGARYYDDESYRIVINTTHSSITATPGLNFGDVNVYVDVTKTTGTDDNLYGVICRWEDNLNYYFMIISSDGYYGIGKTVNGQQALIGSEKMPPSEFIHQGFSSNLLRADCVGDMLTLHVNGEQLISVRDTEFSFGDVGLLAGTLDDSGLEITFSNFSVRKP